GIAQKPRDPDGTRLAAQNLFTQVLDGELLASGPTRGLLEQDLARLGKGLDARGGRHRGTGQRPVHRAGHATRCRDDLAGGQSDPDLERLARWVLQVGEALADRQRAMGGPERVVVVGGRPAEDREHGVADELLARPVEALDRVDHRRERRVDASPDLLRVVLRDEPDVVDEIREEGGDDAPVTRLADLGAPAAVRRGTSARGTTARRRDWRSALIAEPGRRAGDRATRATSHRPSPRLPPRPDRTAGASLLRPDQLIERSGCWSAPAARTLIRAATAPATAVRARAAGPGSRWATAGTPTSPPWRTVTSSGTPPRKSIPCCWQKRSPPPRPKISVSSPQCGQAKAVMFSTRPRIGTESRLNIARALPTSDRATSCGVVTRTAPPSGTDWASVSCASDVPGGRSTTR